MTLFPFQLRLRALFVLFWMCEKIQVMCRAVVVQICVGIHIWQPITSNGTKITRNKRQWNVRYLKWNVNGVVFLTATQGLCAEFVCNIVYNADGTDGQPESMVQCYSVSSTYRNLINLFRSFFGLFIGFLLSLNSLFRFFFLLSLDWFSDLCFRCTESRFY